MSLQKHCAAYESPMIRLGQLCITAWLYPCWQRVHIPRLRLAMASSLKA